MLAGIPSMIYGMWGLFGFAPMFADYVQPALNKRIGQLPVMGVLFQGPQMGLGMLAAGIILAVMVIPFIASVMRDVFEVVPPILKESAYGLVATTWEVVRNIVLPYTKVGVIGGIMLGLGRALGATTASTASSCAVSSTINVMRAAASGSAARAARACESTLG